jgi:hypothetical protein
MPTPIYKYRVGQKSISKFSKKIVSYQEKCEVNFNSLILMPFYPGKECPEPKGLGGSRAGLTGSRG